MAAIELVTCPYDEAHRVKQSRLQMHITKCRQNHLDRPTFVCPFNATHILPMEEKVYHLTICDDKAPLDRRIVQDSLNKNNPYKGRLAVPSYSEAPRYTSEESWEDEIGSGPMYVPPKEAPLGAIVEPPPLSKPAERRKLYQELHTRPLHEADKRPAYEAYSHKVIPQKTFRQPSEASKVESLCNRNSSGIGLGRGNRSRVAANIFPSGPSNSERMLNNGIIPGFSNLAVGRGLPSTRPPTEASIFDASDFPAIGIGRGASRKK